jgi:hypothetical protein
MKFMAQKERSRANLRFILLSSCDLYILGFKAFLYLRRPSEASRQYSTGPDRKPPRDGQICCGIAGNEP